MTNQSFVTLVGLVTAAAVLVTGVVIITGIVLPGVPVNSRILVGCVMIGYGIYRSIILWMKHRSDKKEQPNEPDSI
jgi:preprotein translocase subunit SecF